MVAHEPEDAVQDREELSPQQSSPDPDTDIGAEGTRVHPGLSNRPSERCPEKARSVQWQLNSGWAPEDRVAHDILELRVAPPI